MKKRVLSLLVDNTSGVLSRIAGLFSRRGYNIDSLTVGETADPQIFPYDCSGQAETGRSWIRSQSSWRSLWMWQISRLWRTGDCVERELVLVKVRADATNRQDIIAIANIFRANIVDVALDSLIIELTGNQNKLEAFLKMLEGNEILELARTGITGLSRGADDVRYL